MKAQPEIFFARIMGRERHPLSLGNAELARRNLEVTGTLFQPAGGESLTEDEVSSTESRAKRQVLEGCFFERLDPAAPEAQATDELSGARTYLYSLSVSVGWLLSFGHLSEYSALIHSMRV